MVRLGREARLALVIFAGKHRTGVLSMDPKQKFEKRRYIRKRSEPRRRAAAVQKIVADEKSEQHHVRLQLQTLANQHSKIVWWSDCRHTHVDQLNRFSGIAQTSF